MAWIKIDTTLFNKPEVVRISSLLKIKQTETVGLLVLFWTLADGLTEDGTIPYYGRAEVDCAVNKRGFCQALESVGWIVVTDEGVSIPRFDRHNGRSAKRRAETSRRVNAHRLRNVTDVTREALQAKRGKRNAHRLRNVTDVTREALQAKRGKRNARNEKVTPREEKIRADSLRESLPRAHAREGDPLPPVPSWAPLAKQVHEFAESRGFDREETLKFLLWHRQRGWTLNGRPMADWEAALELWMLRAHDGPVEATAPGAKNNAPPELRADVDLD